MPTGIELIHDKYLERAELWLAEQVAGKMRELGIELPLIERWERDRHKYMEPVMLEIGSRLLTQDEEKQNEQAKKE